MSALLFLVTVQVRGFGKHEAALVWWAFLVFAIAAASIKAAEILVPRPNLRRRHAALKLPQRWALDARRSSADSALPRS